MNKTYILIENSNSGYIAYLGLRHHSIEGNGDTQQIAVDNLLKTIKDIGMDHIEDGQNGLYSLNPDSFACIDYTNV